MQTLEIISVNLWQILISLANLLLIFLILKKFLFAPVQKMLQKRQAQVDEQYAAAEAAEQKARQDQADWEDKLQGAQAQAEELLQRAADTAHGHSDRIMAEARQKADGIVRQAEAQADLERRRAEADIREQIVEVSTQLAEKMLACCIEAAPDLFRRAGPPCVSGGCSEGKMTCGEMLAVREKYRRLREGKKWEN